MAEKKLKAGWQTWRFEQMATNVNVRIDNPSESGMEHYVGLEHLDPDSLRIRRWGSPSDVEAGKLFFKTGDIIFAKRRAYQRKLGVAEFDGICSAHAMVLRAKPEVVLPEFLQFFMQSDLFMNRAVEISVGSLSPTINWKTLAAQVFSLPPMPEQEQIVGLLRTAEEQVEALEKVCHTSRLLYQSLVEKNYSVSPDEHDIVTIAEMSKINPDQMTAKESSENRVIRYIDIGTVIEPKVLGEVAAINLQNASSRARRKVRSGDLIVSTVRPNLKSFARITSDQESCIVSTGFAVIRANDSIPPSFIFHGLFSRRFENFCASKNEGTSYPAIKPSDLAKFTFPRMSGELQKILGTQLDELDQVTFAASTRLSITRKLANSWRDSLMEGDDVL